MSDAPYLAEDGQAAPRFPRVKGRLPPQLTRCLHCQRHLYATAETCGFCGVNQVQQRKKAEASFNKAQKSVERLKALLGEK